MSNFQYFILLSVGIFGSIRMFDQHFFISILSDTVVHVINAG